MWQVVLTTILLACAAHATSDQGRVVQFHEVSQAQYDALLGITEGHNAKTEGRVTVNGIIGVTSYGAGLKTGLALGSLPTIISALNMNSPSGTSEYDEFPLCVIKAGGNSEDSDQNDKGKERQEPSSSDAQDNDDVQFERQAQEIDRRKLPIVNCIVVLKERERPPPTPQIQSRDDETTSTTSTTPMPPPSPPKAPWPGTPSWPPSAPLPSWPGFSNWAQRQQTTWPQGPWTSQNVSPFALFSPFNSYPSYPGYSGWPGTATAGWPGTSGAGWPAAAGGVWPGTAAVGWPGTGAGGWPGIAAGGWPTTGAVGWPGVAASAWPGTSSGGWPGTYVGGWPGTSGGGWPLTGAGGWPGTWPGPWTSSLNTRTSDTIQVAAASKKPSQRLKNSSKRTAAPIPAFIFPLDDSRGIKAVKAKRDQKAVMPNMRSAAEGGYERSVYPQYKYQSNYPKASHSQAGSVSAPVYVMATGRPDVATAIERSRERAYYDELDYGSK